MSCIYGPRQFGNEDQGWLAHFLIQAKQRAPITIYGDGCQVRDALYVDDLIDAMLLAHANIAHLSGEAFNMGGGVTNTLSLLELLDAIEHMTGREAAIEFAAPRTGDQRYYVSDFSRFASLTGWRPRVGVADGLERLHDWVEEARLHAATSVREARR
jgi:CDP-paratose 2-epimerase